MRFLVRLVTRPGGRVLDCFNGSGTTGMAAVLEGCDYVGIDLDEDGEYIPISEARIAWALREYTREQTQDEQQDMFAGVL